MTPKEVVEAYNYELWDKKNYALGETIIADQVVRHYTGRAETLNREAALQRVKDIWKLFATLKFTLIKIIAEGELVTIVYQMDAKNHQGEDVYLSSMEVFRVVDGQICEVWNPAYSEGKWH